MAAVYAAVVSLLQLIDQVQLHNVHWPIFVDKQLRQIESLSKKVRYLQDFLERSSHGRSNEAEALGRRIRDAAYAAEDIIELHVVDDIILTSPRKNHFKKKKNEIGRSTNQRKTRSTRFSQGLQKVIEEVDFCRKETVMIEKDSGFNDQSSGHLARSVSLKNPHRVNDTMVGFDDQLEKMMDKLLSNQSNLQIIPITGMGGIGKTTLAKSIYDHRSIVENFDIRYWFTISQTYDIREILLGLFDKVGGPTKLKKQESGEYHHLGEKLHKRLYGRRYLIVIDDLWSIEAWDKLKNFFPDNKDGSRVVVTTRLSNVAKCFCSSYLHEMNLLDEDASWRLLCSKVFVGQGECPPKLEGIGKKIVKNCKGLPLSIVAIGGLLAKSKMTREFWEYVAKNTKQIVNSEDNDHCLEILSLSYDHLPIHLKPCFLFMGAYPEDYKIRVSKLIKFWVAEGFLKPKETKSLEEAANEYLKDLIDRNLIMVDEWGSIGSIKVCIIHDLLRNLCIREALKEEFFCVVKVRNIHVTKVHDLHISHDINGQRRIAFDSDQYQDRYDYRIPPALQSTTFVRSMTSNFYWDWSMPLNFRLLRLFDGRIDYFQEGNLVNLRHVETYDSHTILSTISRLWNLQTLIVLGYVKCAPPEIWELLHLRYLKMYDFVQLSDPRSRKKDGEDDYLVLENLQRLGCILNFKFTQDIIKRIPNIKKLEIIYSNNPKLESSELCLYNLGYLHKLQSLNCALLLPEIDFFQDLTFPNSVKKLKLNGGGFYHLEHMATKVGFLPNLEKLKFLHFRGEWNPVEGQFVRLKYLEILDCCDMKCWTADSSHFPVLERLVLAEMNMEIPSDIGNIATLKLIHVDSCSDFTVASAEVILEEQQGYGNEDLHLSVSGRNR